jgi:type II secretory ATPase GspE/PulE/Tfp pilus assembly ATPase PilB-like protein
MIQVATHIKQKIAPNQAWSYQVIPLREEGNTLVCGTADVKATEKLRSELEFLLNVSILLEEVPRQEFERTLRQMYRKSEQKKSALSADSGDLLMQILLDAQESGSSDIHIETYYDKARVRYRIDGKLVEKFVIPKQDYPAMVNKIKIRSNLDISEKRLPQDGRIKLGKELNEAELRVSVLPTLYGEKIVMRILKSNAEKIELSAIGFNQQQQSHVVEAIKKPNGIILVSGPTGSGKTTTLYGLLKNLNTEDRNITTVEDPIEYTLEGVNQIQVNESIGLTFSGALRSILRQDPDIIMLGEIRDHETAELAIRAALTGHLVLSTIHTNSAWGIVNRLLDMGIPPYLLEGTMNLAVAQRLVRKLCNSCKKEIDGNQQPIDFTQYPSIKEKIDTYCEPVGCEECHYTGYSGRMALFEVIPITSALRESIRKEQNQVTEYLNEKGIASLQQSALSALKSGRSSLQEVYPLLITE